MNKIRNHIWAKQTGKWNEIVDHLKWKTNFVDIGLILYSFEKTFEESKIEETQWRMMQTLRERFNYKGSFWFGSSVNKSLQRFWPFELHVCRMSRVKLHFKTKQEKIRSVTPGYKHLVMVSVPGAITVPFFRHKQRWFKSKQWFTKADEAAMSWPFHVQKHQVLVRLTEDLSSNYYSDDCFINLKIMYSSGVLDI